MHFSLCFQQFVFFQYVPAFTLRHELVLSGATEFPLTVQACCLFRSTSNQPKALSTGHVSIRWGSREQFFSSLFSSPHPVPSVFLFCCSTVPLSYDLHVTSLAFFHNILYLFQRFCLSPLSPSLPSTLHSSISPCLSHSVFLCLPAPSLCL